jgi:hypothetical protein
MCESGTGQQLAQLLVSQMMNMGGLKPGSPLLGARVPRGRNAEDYVCNTHQTDTSDSDTRVPRGIKRQCLPVSVLAVCSRNTRNIICDLTKENKMDDIQGS